MQIKTFLCSAPTWGQAQIAAERAQMFWCQGTDIHSLAVTSATVRGEDGLYYAMISCLYVGGEAQDDNDD
jgi:hypothetical protein